MSESRFQTALAALPVVSAGLYLLGLSYHLGYLDRFGVESSLFPLATDLTLFLGFLAYTSFGLGPMVYAIAAALILLMAVLIAVILSSSARVKRLLGWFAAKRDASRSTQAPTERMTTLVDTSYSAYLYTTGAFLVVMMLVLVVLLSAQSGREQAEREVEAFKNGKGNWVMLHTPHLPAPVPARMIMCSETHCAFWLGNESLTLPHEAIERIVGHHASTPKMPSKAGS